MMCDFIIAADNAKFGQPEINIGVIAGFGGTQRLTKAVGKAKSMEMHLTGRFMDAKEAESSGLVSRVVPAKRSDESCFGIGCTKDCRKIGARDICSQGSGQPIA